jgi:hypothetical protein
MEIETPVRRRADVCREQSDTPDAKALLVLMSASFACVRSGKRKAGKA